MPGRFRRGGVGREPGSSRFGGDFIEGVVGHGMEHAFACGGADSGRFDLVDVPGNQRVHFQQNAHAVLGDAQGAEGGKGLVDLGAAVVLLVEVGEGAQSVGGGLGSGAEIDGTGEGDFKSAGPGPDLAHLEGHLARPVHAFEGEGMGALGTPAPVRAADKQLAPGAHARRDGAGSESFEEGENGALRDAADVFEKNAGEVGESVVGDEELAGEGTELSVAVVACDGGGGDADPVGAVREVDGGGDELGDASAFVLQAAGVAGFCGWGAEFGGEGVPPVASRVSEESAGSEGDQQGGAPPGALIVGIEGAAFRIEPDAAWGPNAAAGGGDGSIGCHAQGPAAEAGVAAEGTGEAANGPEVALGIKAGAEGVLVVIAADAPGGADGFKGIGMARALGVAQADDLGAGGGEQCRGGGGSFRGRCRRWGRLKGEAEHFVQPAGEAVVAEGGGVWGNKGLGALIPGGGSGKPSGAAEDPDIASAGPDGEGIVREELQGADFERGTGWGGEGRDGVEDRLRGVGAALVPEVAEGAANAAQEKGGARGGGICRGGGFRGGGSLVRRGGVRGRGGEEGAADESEGEEGAEGRETQHPGPEQGLWRDGSCECRCRRSLFVCTAPAPKILPPHTL
ncbi:MAG: hypothetical protein RLZZ244_3145 [Verrucomicrobiota bacterium]